MLSHRTTQWADSLKSKQWDICEVSAVIAGEQTNEHQVQLQRYAPAL